jgi:hypothetical protein
MALRAMLDQRVPVHLVSMAAGWCERFSGCAGAWPAGRNSGMHVETNESTWSATSRVARIAGIDNIETATGDFETTQIH